MKTETKTDRYQYLVRGEIGESCISSEGDWLTDDPTGGLEGLFQLDDDDERTQEDYDRDLIDLHVSPAVGEFRPSPLGTWYLDGNQWKWIGDDGELRNCMHGPDGPDECDGWELGESMPEDVHPTWWNHPDYLELKSRTHHFSPFVVSGTNALLRSRDWSADNPQWRADWSPRILANGVEVMGLRDAVSRGFVQFRRAKSGPGYYADHGGIYMTAKYSGHSEKWTDVHVWGRGYDKFYNCSAAKVYRVASDEVVAPPSDMLMRSWHVGVQNDEVVWIAYVFGVDYSSGGQYDLPLCGDASLRIAAAIVSAGYNDE